MAIEDYIPGIAGAAVNSISGFFTNKMNSDEAAKNRQWQYAMMLDKRNYDAPANVANRLIAAGVNPSSFFNNGSGVAPSAMVGGVSNPNMQNAMQDFNAQNVMAIQLMSAQKDKLEAEANLINTKALESGSQKSLNESLTKTEDETRKGKVDVLTSQKNKLDSAIDLDKSTKNLNNANALRALSDYILNFEKVKLTKAQANEIYANLVHYQELRQSEIRYNNAMAEQSETRTRIDQPEAVRADRLAHDYVFDKDFADSVANGDKDSIIKTQEIVVEQLNLLKEQAAIARKNNDWFTYNQIMDAAKALLGIGVTAMAVKGGIGNPVGNPVSKPSTVVYPRGKYKAAGVRPK